MNREGSRKSRGRSCPPMLDGYTSESDSLSTAPTHFSPFDGASGDVGSRDSVRAPMNVVVVSNLPGGTTHAWLVQLLSNIGFRMSLNTIKLFAQSKSGCSAMITLPNADVAMSLFHLMHGEKVSGKEVAVTLSCGDFVHPGMDSFKAKTTSGIVKLHKPCKIPPSMARKGGKLTSKIFVGGLHPSTEPKGLRSYFSQFGAIKDCGIVKDFAGVSRRFGFCEFWSPAAVADVLQLPEHAIDNQVLGVRPYCLRD